MATYECEKCGMSVNATCGKCDAPLVNDTLARGDGGEVQISKCPNDHGKIHQIRALRHYSEGSFYGYQVNAEKVQENMLGW